MTALQLPPTELPDPHPPSGRKRDLYYDPAVFKELDEDVFKVCLFIFCHEQMRDLGTTSKVQQRLRKKATFRKGGIFKPMFDFSFSTE